MQVVNLWKLIDCVTFDIYSLNSGGANCVIVCSDKTYYEFDPMVMTSLKIKLKNKQINSFKKMHLKILHNISSLIQATMCQFMMIERKQEFF